MTVQALLSNTIPATPENLTKTFSIASRQIARLTHLVDELLNVSRIRAGRLALELDDVDLAAVVREVLERFEAELVANWHARVVARAPAVGRWDKSALDQVVTNIVSNALKFGAGKPIEVTVEAVNGTAKLEVVDHGIGIPTDRVPHVFERFERAVSARQYGGLGLGLYIARAIVEALGGSIRARSAGPDQGATFTVELPRARGACRMSAHRTILVVEDDLDIREVMRMVLEASGYEVRRGRAMAPKPSSRRARARSVSDPARSHDARHGWLPIPRGAATGSGDRVDPGGRRVGWRWGAREGSPSSAWLAT